MRNNQPVTQKEYLLRDGAMIVSKTDLKGRITYVNDDFIEASGFTTAELIGQPHNLVRHPDMPPEAFEDLWNTLKAGKPWTGLVKNRRKNGDHYWVVANATPLMEGNQVTGYLSVRGRPTREQVAAAEEAYREFREGRAGAKAIREGGIVSTGLLSRINVFAKVRDHASLGQKFLLLGLLCLVPIVLTMTQLASQLREGVVAAQKERQGLEVHVAMRALLEQLQIHRGLSGRLLSGESAVKGRIDETQKKIEAAIAAVDGGTARHGAAFGFDKTWVAVRENWKGLRGQMPSLTTAESVKRHSDLISGLL